MNSIRIATYVASNLEERRTNMEMVGEAELDLSMVTHFGVNCSRIFNRKGRFLRWQKYGWVSLDGKSRISCGYYDVQELRRIFTKRRVLHKQTHSMPKYSANGWYVGDRKATDWSYEVIR